MTEPWPTHLNNHMTDPQLSFVIQVWVLIWIWCLYNVHVPFPNPCPCIAGLIIVLHQRWWLYKLYARQPLDQCQSGRSYLVECNYIALPCRHQASQCAAYNSPTEGVQCKQRHTVIFDPAQVWQSLICRLGRGGAADSAKHGRLWNSRAAQIAKPKH